jgi:predicted lipoprotein
MKTLRHTSLFIAAGWLFSAAVSAAPALDAAADDQAMKNKVLGELVENVIRPMARDFSAASAKLADVSKGFCRGQAKLADVRTAWRNTQSAWQALEMMPIGPVSENRLHRHINAWPVRERLLKPLLEAGAGADVEQVRRMGAAGKGLPAVEYLLFEEKGQLAHPHCAALTALTGQIREEAQSLSRAWTEPDGGFGWQLAQAGKLKGGAVFVSADQAMSDIVNLLIAGLDSIKIRKLGKAMERSSDEPALARIESWRSGTSLDNIDANLRSFEAVFFGKGKSGVGLDDYLASIERPGLGRAISRQLDITQRALADVRLPLHTALIEQPEAVASLHKEISWLQYLMETEVAGALNVDLSFNANDGD